MLRKKGKMPNTVTGEAYAKEYAGNDALSIPRGAVSKGDKVLVIDDLGRDGRDFTGSHRAHKEIRGDNRRLRVRRGPCMKQIVAARRLTG